MDGGGDGSGMGSVTQGEENRNRGPLSMPASPRTSETKRRATINIQYIYNDS